MSEKKIVLAIDDSIQQLDEFKSMLTPEYDLRVVKSATEAIKYLNKSTADIILLDIQMPNINGYEFLSDIRRIPSHGKTPVIIVSGTISEALSEKAMAIGAANILHKPVGRDQLIEAIEKVFA